jgi:hypothetical protein
VVAKNNGDREADKLIVTQPIPKGTVYAIGSATRNTAVTYSIDSGKTFAENPLVQVTLPDGRVQMQPAPPEVYTHVRWTVGKAIAPRNGVELAYDVSVR